MRRDLPEYEVRTVQEQGWAGLKNGELLRRAEEDFTILLTRDKRLQFQQNIASFRIAVVVVDIVRITPANVRLLIPHIKSAIERAQPGTVIVASAG